MQGYTRCLHIEEGQQCETWFPANGKEFCEIHSDSKYVELVNEEREFIYQFFEDITHPTKLELDRLDAHIQGIETEMQKLKTRFLSSRAVKREAVSHLSEAERQERLKYKPAKQQKEKKEKTKKERKPRPSGLSIFKQKGMTDEQISALMSMDNEEELLAVFEEAKKKRGEKTD